VALDLLGLFRKLVSLMQLETKHGASIRRLEADVVRLYERVTCLEGRDAVLIAEATSAVASAASVTTSSTVADLARRIGVLEERTRTGRLPPSRSDEA
jgi:hypothetical protein